jgi:hypothetical protein
MILVTLLAPKQMIQKTVAPDLTMTLKSASPVCTAQMQRVSVPMHIALVRPSQQLLQVARCLKTNSFSAFDDQTSTFIIPSGGGFGITFCPAGKSTTILKSFGAQLAQVGQGTYKTDLANLSSTVKGLMTSDADVATLVPSLVLRNGKANGSVLGLVIALTVAIGALDFLPF